MDNDQLNQYALDLSKWLESVPIFPNSDEVAIKSYVDYIYEQAFQTNIYMKTMKILMTLTNIKMSKVRYQSGIIHV